MQQKLSCCDRYASDEVIMKVSKTKSGLINEGDYNVGKPDKKQVSGGRAAGWRPRARLPRFRGPADGSGSRR